MSTHPTEDPRYTALAADIAARLRHVCEHLDDEAFARLVGDLARLKLGWAARYGEPIGIMTPPVPQPAVPPPR